MAPPSSPRRMPPPVHRRWTSGRSSRQATAERRLLDMLAFSRVVVGIGVVMLALGGLFAIGVPDARPAAIWLIASALVLGAALAWERGRYRSDGAPEGRRTLSEGSGGVPEAGSLPPRFRPTDEVFADPTTGRRMRVWLDDRTGDRRYREES